MKKTFYQKPINLIFFAIILLLLILTFFIYKAKTKDEEPSQTPSVTTTAPIVISEDQYLEDISKILSNYDEVVKMADINNASIKTLPIIDSSIFTKIDSLKIAIMEQKAPSTKYKDLHINIITSISSIKDYLKTPSNKKREACIKQIDNVKNSRDLLLK